MAKHYVTINENSVILRGFSGDFEQPSANDVCICENGGRHFELNGTINPRMRDDSGVPLYNLIDGVVVERSEAERQTETTLVILAPTLEERTTALESALLEMVLGGEL